MRANSHSTASFTGSPAVQSHLIANKNQARNEMEGDSTEREVKVQTHLIEPQGIIKKRLFTLAQISEKPTVEFAQEHLRVEGIPDQQYLCNFGIDLLNPLLFDILDYNYRHRIVTHGEIQLRDAMTEMIKQEGMSGYRVAGKRYDTGNPQDLLKTVNAFGLDGPYGNVLI